MTLYNPTTTLKIDDSINSGIIPYASLNFSLIIIGNTNGMQAIIPMAIELNSLNIFTITPEINPSQSGSFRCKDADSVHEILKIL